MLRYRNIELVGFSLALSIAVAAAHGQATFTESFENLGGQCGEGPCRLIDDGWQFKDQGTLDDGPAWMPSFVDDVPAHSGSSFMRCLKGIEPGSIATWAILPAIPNQQAGDALSFFARGELLEDGVLEVRYSPTGGPNTGSAATDVGDFTQVLTTITSLSHQGWSPFSTEVPGNGRIALRVYDPFQSFSGPDTVVNIDTLAFNAELPGPPVPGQGEVVTWTTDMSPIVIDTQIVIPPGGTVIVEPGVVIDVQGDGGLSIEGDMVAHGAAAQPITLTAPFFFAPAPVRVTGSLDMAFVTASGVIQTRDGLISAVNCNFPGGFLSSSNLSDAPQLIFVRDCQFNDGGIGVQDGQLTVRDSSLVDGGISVLRGFIDIDNVTIDGAALSIDRQDSPQTILIDNVSIINSTTIAALHLGGWNFLIGPTATLQSSLYPIELRGGLMPGSNVPTAGNTNNYIYVPTPQAPMGRALWPPFDVPYVIDGTVGGPITFLPGADVRFTAGSSAIWSGGIQPNIEGLPDAPIHFSPFGGQWDTMLFGPGSVTAKVEFANIEGGDNALIATDTILRVENTLLQNNVVGSNSNTFGVTLIRKSQFLNNGTGVQGSETGSFNISGATNPNWVEGNGVGIIDPDGAPQAQFNWWGDSTGPMHPANPGGQGDSASGNARVLPFLTAPPDLADHPPVVRLKHHQPYAEAGDMLILSWDAFDDPNGEIVKFRVEFSPHFPNDYTVITDNIPGTQRSVAVTVPVVEPSSNNAPSVFRVVGTDDSGQEGLDETSMRVPISFAATGDLPAPPDVIMGGVIQLQGTISRELHFDATGDVIQLGVLSDPNAPFVSTDLARIAQVDFQTGQRVFSEYFSIRPDPMIGDAAPIVTLNSPTGGSFAGGSVVPISWSASDDEAVRTFAVHASYNAGTTWQVIASDLPSDATSFNWQLPPAEEEIANVFVRVVVFDHRFQSSADTSGPITITPGEGNPADLNNDGVVNEDDRAVLCEALGSSTGDPNFLAAADLNSDNVIDELDQQMFNKILPPCAGDIVTTATFDLPADGMTDAADLAFLLGAWGAQPSCADFVSSATFTPPPDGVVDAADLAFLLSGWGACD